MLMARSVLVRWLAILMPAVALLGAAPAKAAPENLAISVAVGNAIYWDVFVAVERGFFKAEGFDPHYVSMSSSTNSTQNLVSGGVNLQGGSPEPMVDAMERGARIGILCAASARSSGLLIVPPAIKTAADLKGKRIGVSALKGGEMWELRELLSRNGVTPHDYQVTQIGISPAKYAALQRGSIAGAVLLQPSAMVAEKNGFHALLSFWSVESYPYPVYAVGRDWAHKAQHGQRVSRAIAKAHAWLIDAANRAAAVAVLQKTTHQSHAIAAGTYQQMIATDHFFVPGATVDLAGMGRLLDAMRGEGDVSGHPDPKTFLIPASDGGLSK